MINSSSFGIWVQQQRKALDLTQAELAERIGCAPVTIKKIEQNRRRPSRQLAHLLAQELQLLEGEHAQFIAAARGMLDKPMPSPATPQMNEPAYQCFVGREQQLSLLDTQVAKMLAGEAQVGFVTGEAGRGKSSLLIEFARRVRREHADVIVVGGSCNAFAGAGDPYLPFRDIFNALIGEADTQWLETTSVGQKEQLQEQLPLTTKILMEHSPELLDVLISSKALCRRFVDCGPKQQTLLRQVQARAKEQTQNRSNVQQRQIFEQTRQFLLAFTQQTPLVLLFDDMQWVDTATVDLLFYLLQRIHHSRLFILGAYRASEVITTQTVPTQSRPHPLWAVTTELKRQFGDIEIDLEQLPVEENRAFLDALLDSEANQLDHRFRERLFAHTRGYPLFTVELLRAMEEQEILQRNDVGTWIEAQQFNWNSLPTRIDAAIAQRMIRLPITLQEILRIAAVEGEAFTAEVVADVLSINGATVIQQLSYLLNRQLCLVESTGLQRVNSRTLTHFKFRHILFQYYLYHEIDDISRTRLHQAVAEALEKLYGDERETIVPQLAIHHKIAGNQVQAINYLLLAGKHAIQLSAYTAAIHHLQTGLDLINQQSISLSRDQQELEFQLSLSIALGAIDLYTNAAVEAVYERALILCKRLNQVSSPTIIRGLAMITLLRGNYRKTHEWAAELLQSAKAIEQPLAAVEAHYTFGVNYFWQGEFQLSRQHLETVLDKYRPQQHAGHILLFGQNPAVVCQQRLGYTLWHLGHPQQALDMVEGAVALAEQLAHPFTLAYIYAFTAWFYVDCRETKRASQYAQLAITYAKENDIFYWNLIGQIFSAWSSAATVEQKWKARKIALTNLHNAIHHFRTRGLGCGWPFLCLLLAEQYGQNQQLSEAFSILDEGFRCANQNNERWCLPEIHRIHGILLLQQSANGLAFSKAAAAEKSFFQAIATAQEIDAKLYELRATLSLSRLWHQQGKTQAAHEILTAIYSWFTEGFETSDLLDARALLDQFSD